MIRINLLAADRPAAGGKKKAASASAPGTAQAYLIVGGLVGLAIAGSALMWFLKSNEIDQLNTKIAAAQDRQRQLQDIKKQVDELEKKRTTFQRKVDLIEQLKAEQSGPVHMLDEISKSLPDFVWLTGLTQTGGSVVMNGQSNSLTAVADYILALQRSGWFPIVDLASSTEDQNIVTFSLNTQFKNPEVAAREAAAKAKAPANAPPPKR